MAMRSTGVALPPNRRHERGTRMPRLGEACGVLASNADRPGTVKSRLRLFFPSLVRRDYASAPSQKGSLSNPFSPATSPRSTSLENQ